MSEIETNNSPAVAFGLVIAAGAATAIGAALVFFPRLVKLANRRVLAASLGVATGVMLYVGLVDIYGKSTAGFEESGHDEGHAFIYTTLCFFGGILVMMFINQVIIGYLLIGKFSADHLHPHEEFAPTKSERAAGARGTLRREGSNSMGSFNVMDVDDEAGMYALRPIAVHQYDNAQYIAEKVEKTKNPNNQETEETVDEEEAVDEEEELPKATDPEEPKTPPKEFMPEHANSDEGGKLMHMGMATAVAIALHNFPEGLATFVAYMADSTVGIVLCVGICLHNIPEGVVVSMPIYYASGNRLKAFLWGTLSGVSEPLGALIGWAVLARSGFSGNTYGILFGFVAGIMTYIAVDELIPTALSYDPKNTLVTYSVIVGMFIMAASLMIFSV